MWRNFNFLPINLVESSDDSYDSPAGGEVDENPLVSPHRPHQSPTASPRALLIPDPPPIDEVLEGVNRQLRNLPDRDRRRQEREQQAAAAAAAQPVMPNVPEIVNFEDENGEDVAQAMQEACRNLQRFAWDSSDLKFTFQKMEIKMSAVGVKKQYTKFQILSTIIPKVVEDEVKGLICKQESEFPNRNAYKLLKSEIFRIFGPRPEAAIERALTRVLVGKPSQLARALVADICKSELDCTCCPDIISALWKRQLPADVKAGIAHMKFSKATFKDVCKLADDIFDSNRPAAPSLSVAAVSIRGAGAAVAAQASPPSFLDETQPALDYPFVQEVAAVSRGGRGGRGGRRGGRGFRGGRGGSQNQAQTSSGGSSGGSGGGGGNSQPKFKGTPHPDLPAGAWQGCSMHFKFGKSAYFCAEPSTCPWKNVFIARPQK